MATQAKDKYQSKSPETFEELISNLDLIIGKSIAMLAETANVPLPISPTHGKGFTGELLELILGATAQNQPIPDFPKLGLELKTIPVDRNLEPLESTFLCHAPLTNIRNLTFENSALYSKVMRVLFILITAEKQMDYTQRKIEGYFFFTPDQEQLQQLRRDFNELYEFVKTGNISQLSARYGQIIQLRPKAANGQALTDCIGPEGQIIKTRPRGFYMRREFTKKIIEKYLRF
ncbi:MAG: DNA mismatch repair protein MutH [Succinivibrio sp.]